MWVRSRSSCFRGSAEASTMVLTDGIYGTRGAALYEDRVGRLVGRRCGLGWWLSGMLV